jgi:hypothetical protein
VTRARALLIAAALAFAMIAGSSPRVVGDGGEYLVLALNFAAFQGPAVDPNRLPGLSAEVGRASPALATWDIAGAGVTDHRGRIDFLHFWVYSLLATPGVWLMQAVGANPLVAFTALNLVLVLLALWVALPRLGAALTVLLFGGPVVWWLDKAHTEAFTFSLLVIAIVLIREKPAWSMIAAALASTQNPPIALLVAVVFALQLRRGRALLRDGRLLLGLAVAAALVLLGPMYSCARHGTPSLLLLAAHRALPAPAEFWAVLLDPEIGLLANFPALALAGAGALTLLLWKKPRAFLDLEVGAMVLVAAVFLFSFGQAGNVHHGATPSLSRYGLWLIPLALPILTRAGALGGGLWRSAVWSLAIVSALANAVIFNPAVPENSREPTWLADYLWSAHPGWDNPLPEVFAETLTHAEARWVPVATPGCEKILISGRSGHEGWPVPCYPAVIPKACEENGVLCYANLEHGRYEFAFAPGKWNGGFPLLRQASWPLGEEAVVRRLYDEWNWTTFTVSPTGTDMLRAAYDVHVAALLRRGPDMIFVLRQPGAGAHLTFRSAGPLDGTLYDGHTGSILQPVHFDGGQEAWLLSIPDSTDFLFLTMKVRGRP